MGHKNYCVVSGGLFVLVALAHLLRIVYGMSIQIDDFAVPMLASWIGLILPAGLAFWAFRITRGTNVAYRLVVLQQVLSVSINCSHTWLEVKS